MNMTITKRLLLAFGISFAIAILTGIIGLRGISSSTGTTKELVDLDVDFMANAQKLKIEALQHRRYEKDFFLNIGNPEKQAGYIKKFNEVSGALKKRLAHLAQASKQKLMLPETVNASLAGAQTAYAAYYENFMALTQKVLNDETITPQQGNEMMTPFKKSIYEFETNVDKVVVLADEHLVGKTEGANTAGARSKKIILLCLFLGAAALSAAAFFTVTRVRSGLKTLSRQMEAIATGEGDLTRRIEVKNKDELGEVAHWFNVFAEKLQGVIAKIAKNSKHVDQAAGELTQLAGHLSSGAEDTSARANNLSAAAEEMSANLNAVAAAMEQSSTNTAMVATAAEEMSATISEIAQNAERARGISDQAVSQSKNAAGKMDELGKAALAIGKVTETITEISEQTNLLALNATIEAARAGDAGKGFAVVANEIKDLARQTAEATLDIKRQIQGIQETTTGTVDEINQISAVIDQVNETVATIATAVEEQSSATREIASNISQASQGIQDVNQNVGQSSSVASEITQDIAGVNTSADDISSSSSQVKLSADDLQRMAAELSQVVAGFKI